MIEKTPKRYAPVKDTIVRKLAKTRLSAYESCVIWANIDKTYGWCKKDGSRKTEDYISLSQYVELTEMNESHVSRTIKLLLQRRILTKRGKKMGINKQVDEWQNLPKGVNTHTGKNLPIGVSELTDRGKKNLPKGGDTQRIHRETYTQRNNTGALKCPGANEILKFYKETYGFKKNVPKQLENWRAAKWLFEQYGVEKTCHAILAGKSALEDSVAGEEKVPLIKNLMDLKEKYDQLRAYYGRKKRGEGIVDL